MTLIALILIIRIMTDPSRSWNRRSRVAGQEGDNCRNCWCVGRWVSPSHARQLAFLHPYGIPWERSPCSRPARGARPVGDPRLSPLCSCLLQTLIMCDGGCLWPLFSMNVRPNRNLLFCNNATNFSNKWNNSVINANNSHNTAQFWPSWNQLQLPWCFLNLKWHPELSPAYLQCVGHY